MATRSIPELSLDTQTLERVLESVAVGDVVAYTTLTAAIDRDVQTVARGNLRSARARLLRSSHLVFGAVLGLGLKRLDDVGKIGAGYGHRNKGRNQFKKAVKTVAAVDDFNALPNSAKVDHNVLVAQAGAILHMTGTAVTKKLNAAVGVSSSRFTPKESLELMKASI